MQTSYMCICFTASNRQFRANIYGFGHNHVDILIMSCFIVSSFGTGWNQLWDTLWPPLNVAVINAEHYQNFRYSQAIAHWLCSSDRRSYNNYLLKAWMFILSMTMTMSPEFSHDESSGLPSSFVQSIAQHSPFRLSLQTLHLPGAKWPSSPAIITTVWRFYRSFLSLDNVEYDAGDTV